MARITAVIDVGSNSARMAVFERTSRFGFHLLCEVKSRVRISENAYKNGGFLQEEAMKRAENALNDFAAIAKSYGARKTLVVATSAVRDAPNRAEFLSRVKAKTKLSIRVISGFQEAQCGGIAAANLLNVENGVTIDIGGGSTEFALIRGSRVIDGISFDLGTVRLKEMFFDAGGKEKAKEAVRFVNETLSVLPAAFKGETIIGVGGTMRALAGAVIRDAGYPFEILHGFTFSIADRLDFIDRTIKSDNAGLKALGFKSDRFDVIREGSLIFKLAAAALGANTAVVSGVGVREGVFLSDLLRSQNGRLPAGVQPSLISLLDRFGDDKRQVSFIARLTAQLFDVLAPVHNLGEEWKKLLVVAAKLLGTGIAIDPYYPAAQESLLAQNALAYGFTHGERLLIATLLKVHAKKILSEWQPQKGLERLLPDAITVRTLAAILCMAQTINSSRSFTNPTLALGGRTLTIGNVSYLAREALSRFKPPIDIEIEIE